MSDDKPMPEKPFTVIAGKHDDFGRNCKYSAQFKTLNAAISVLDTVSGYPWSYIQFNGRTIEVWPKDVSPFEEDRDADDCYF